MATAKCRSAYTRIINAAVYRLEIVLHPIYAIGGQLWTRIFHAMRLVAQGSNQNGREEPKRRWGLHTPRRATFGIRSITVLLLRFITPRSTRHKFVIFSTWSLMAKPSFMTSAGILWGRSIVFPRPHLD